MLRALKHTLFASAPFFSLQILVVGNTFSYYTSLEVKISLLSGSVHRDI